jgi:hypothetical protein
MNLEVLAAAFPGFEQEDLEAAFEVLQELQSGIAVGLEDAQPSEVESLQPKILGQVKAELKLREINRQP